ncbi:MAG: 30S ribosomal protein S6 [candidate division Zixibacteria bacterium]|nr:30S ribosomal protein S6 [candidate division Zixibacteria bacterium]
MKIYELTFILTTTLDENAADAEIKGLTDQIKALDGNIFEIQHLGVKKMTFEISKQRQGNYITIYYEGVPTIPKQLEKSMKHNENILRNMTIVLKPSEYKPPVKEEEKLEEVPEVAGESGESGESEESKESKESV